MLLPVVVDGQSQIMRGHCRRRTPFQILQREKTVSHCTPELADRGKRTGRSNVSSSDGPVSELFAVLSLESISLDHGFHDLHDLRFGDTLLEGLVQSLTVVASTKHHEVSTGSLSNESNFGSPWSSTTLYRNKQSVAVSCRTRSGQVRDSR
jgi:hypothetical protein